MGDTTAKTMRKPRADAARNREKVLEAAKDVLGAGGPDASLEAVARRAGVGIGTLYRHFPTREALFEAVYRREVDQLAALADELADEAEPLDALRRWLHANVALVGTKRGMLTTLELATHKPSDLYAYSSERLTKAIGMLMARGTSAGVMRADITAEELLKALVGMCYMRDQDGWQESVKHLVDIFVDGLAKADDQASGQG